MAVLNVRHSLMPVRRSVTESLTTYRSCTELQKLPPTNEDFAENVVRAYLQVATWKHAIHLNLPNMDPLTHMGGQDVTVPVAHLWLL